MREMTVEVYEEGEYFGSGVVTSLSMNNNYNGPRYSIEAALIKHKLNKMKENYGCTDIAYQNDRCDYSTEKPKINMNETFYMNYAENGGTPTHCFTSEKDALAEAARLASNHKTNVYTLKAYMKTKPKHDVVTEELKEKTLPEKTES